MSAESWPFCRIPALNLLVDAVCDPGVSVHILTQNSLGIPSSVPGWEPWESMAPGADSPSCSSLTPNLLRPGQILCGTGMSLLGHVCWPSRLPGAAKSPSGLLHSSPNPDLGCSIIARAPQSPIWAPQLQHRIQGMHKECQDISLWLGLNLPFLSILLSRKHSRTNFNNHFG